MGWLGPLFGSGAANPHWDRVAAQARAILGPHFDEFCGLIDLAREQSRPAQVRDSFLRDYTDDRSRPDHLVLCRRLLAQHREVMLRGM